MPTETHAYEDRLWCAIKVTNALNIEPTIRTSLFRSHPDTLASLFRDQRPRVTPAATEEGDRDPPPGLEDQGILEHPRRLVVATLWEARTRLDHTAGSKDRNRELDIIANLKCMLRLLLWRGPEALAPESKEHAVDPPESDPHRHHPQGRGGEPVLLYAVLEV